MMQTSGSTSGAFVLSVWAVITLKSPRVVTLQPRNDSGTWRTQIPETYARNCLCQTHELQDMELGCLAVTNTMRALATRFDGLKTLTVCQAMVQ